MKLLYTAHVPAGDGPFPTVIAVHGWGVTGHDLLGLAPILHGGEALVLCPQGPVTVSVGPGTQGYGWFPIIPGTPPNPVDFARGATTLGAFIDQVVARYPVDLDRLILLGFSQGGMMAYDQALRQPGRFRGLAALSTWLPEALVASLPDPEAPRGFPVLVVHGTDDTMIAVSKARASRDLLRTLDVDLSYREFPMGHEIHPPALQVLREWLEGLL